MQAYIQVSGKVEARRILKALYTHRDKKGHAPVFSQGGGVYDNTLTAYHTGDLLVLTCSYYDVSAMLAELPACIVKRYSAAFDEYTKLYVTNVEGVNMYAH